MPSGDSTEFTFTPTNYNGNATFTDADTDAAQVFSNLTPGATVYTTTETLNGSYQLTGRTCALTGGGAHAFTTPANGLTVTVASGADVTCTLTHTMQRRI